MAFLRGFGPANNKSKTKKRKPTREQRAAEEEFNKLKDKWANTPKFASGHYAPAPTSAKVKKNDPKIPALLQEKVKAARDLPSLKTNEIATSKAEPKKYTGSKMMGISTMHKSNMVPVFSEEEATDIAKMRRG